MSATPTQALVISSYRRGQTATVVKTERSDRGFHKLWYWLHFPDGEGDGWYSEDEVALSSPGLTE